MKLTRRMFLGGLTGGVLAIPGGYAYARHIEPHWLRQVDLEIPLGLHRPIRLAHLSDFHASPVVPLAFIERAVDLTIAATPELVCLTGDFITQRLEQATDYARILRKLSDAAPTVACVGNHDGGVWVEPRGGYPDLDAVGKLLHDAGIDRLHNRSKLMRVGDQPLRIVGVGDLWAGELDPVRAFADAPPPGTPTVLLSHNPDSKTELAATDWDLMLCGHTHGGQLALPFIGTPFAPVHDHRFVHGLHPWNDRWLHITSGVGNLHGMRFNCRPEIALLTLR